MGRSSIRLATVACALFAVGFASAALAATGSETKTDAAGQYRKWIAEMKDDARGPFAAIKWFCKDGRVLAPKDFSCAKKGEGWQHGEWSDRTKQLRSQGYKVANVLAGIDAGKAVADPAFPDAYAQLLVEKFLIATDSGWILRNAQFYRGAIQEEDEREAARNLLVGDGGAERVDRLPLPGPAGRCPAPAARRRDRLGAESAEHGGRESPIAIPPSSGCG